MPDHIFKVVVVGEDQDGKSHLVERFTRDGVPKANEAVVDTGSREVVFNVAGQPHSADVSLWDSAGAEDYDRLRPLSYFQTDLFLLVVPAAEEAVRSRIQAELRWIPELTGNDFCTAPVFLVGSKADLADNLADFNAWAEEFVREHKLLGFATCSSADAAAVEAAVTGGFVQLLEAKERLAARGEPVRELAQLIALDLDPEEEAAGLGREDDAEASAETAGEGLDLPEKLDTELGPEDGAPEEDVNEAPEPENDDAEYEWLAQKGNPEVPEQIAARFFESFGEPHRAGLDELLDGALERLAAAGEGEVREHLESIGEDLGSFMGEFHAVAGFEELAERRAAELLWQRAGAEKLARITSFPAEELAQSNEVFRAKVALLRDVEPRRLGIPKRLLPLRYAWRAAEVRRAGQQYSGVFRAAVRLLDAGFAAATTPADKVAVLSEVVRKLAAQAKRNWIAHGGSEEAVAAPLSAKWAVPLLYLAVIQSSVEDWPREMIALSHFGGAALEHLSTAVLALQKVIARIADSNGEIGDVRYLDFVLGELPSLSGDENPDLESEVDKMLAAAGFSEEMDPELAALLADL